MRGVLTLRPIKDQFWFLIFWKQIFCNPIRWALKSNQTHVMFVVIFLCESLLLTRIRHVITMQSWTSSTLIPSKIPSRGKESDIWKGRRNYNGYWTEPSCCPRARTASRLRRRSSKGRCQAKLKKTGLSCRRQTVLATQIVDQVRSRNLVLTPLALQTIFGDKLLGIVYDIYCRGKRLSHLAQLARPNTATTTCPRLPLFYERSMRTFIFMSMFELTYQGFSHTTRKREATLLWRG